jgi:hypothetical protein
MRRIGINARSPASRTTLPVIAMSARTPPGCVNTSPAASSTDDIGRSAPRRKHVIAGAVIVTVAMLTFPAYRFALESDMSSNACDLTPPGYDNQRLLRVDQHVLWYDCVLDPGNGDPTHTIHRPFQVVHGA